MAEPKLLRIIKAAALRLEAIDASGDYITRIGSRVIRGRRRFNDGELPAVAVFFPGRVLDEQIGDSARCAATLVIEGHHLIGDDHAEDIAISMLADIQRAIEGAADKTLGGLLIKRLSFVEESIIYPENDSATVQCQVVYSIPHTRPAGDPEN